jgi:hypothetical protein
MLVSVFSPRYDSIRSQPHKRFESIPAPFCSGTSASDMLALARNHGIHGVAARQCISEDKENVLEGLKKFRVFVSSRFRQGGDLV